MIENTVKKKNDSIVKYYYHLKELF